MKILFAPLEGITYSEYRLLHSQMFGGVDEYYCPFLAPSGNGDYKIEFLRKKLGTAEGEAEVIPQLLANNPKAFAATANLYKQTGCKEVNLNAGCPSGTVVSKHKGAGMLTDLDFLDSFLDQIFDAADIKISIKTRMGISSTDEFEEILNIYNKYPISKLIIHARDKNGMYKSSPDIEAFGKAARNSVNPVYYNGDIFSCEDLRKIEEYEPYIKGIMVGRGAVANPALPRMLVSGKEADKEELIEFHDRMKEAYTSAGLTPNYVVERMKNLWKYMGVLFPGCDKEMKAINKSKKMPDYESAAKELFTKEFDNRAIYHE